MRPFQYAAEVLTSVAGLDLSAPELRDAWMEVVAGVESDHYRAEALSALLARRDLGDEHVLAVIEAARTLESDHYKAQVLEQVVDVHRSQRLAEGAGVGVVEQVVQQRERPAYVGLAPLVVADDLLGHRESLQQVPEEAHVQPALGDADRSVVELLGGEPLEFLAGRHGRQA